VGGGCPNLATLRLTHSQWFLPVAWSHNKHIIKLSLFIGFLPSVSAYRGSKGIPKLHDQWVIEYCSHKLYNVHHAIQCCLQCDYFHFHCVHLSTVYTHWADVSLSGRWLIAVHDCHLSMFFRSCILYYINFNTLFACCYPCASWKLCFCHKTTYTWPPPEIDGEACLDRTIFTWTYSTTLWVAHYLAEMVYLVHTLHFFLACLAHCSPWIPSFHGFQIVYTILHEY